MKKNTPNRIRRLQSAKEWIKVYSGKHIVRSYSKRYGVDKICAINELRMIGIHISSEYEAQVKQSIEALKKAKQLKKLKKEQELNAISGLESDDNFAFIAGYTSGGFPYGITHEEMEFLNDEIEE